MDYTLDYTADERDGFVRVITGDINFSVKYKDMTDQQLRSHIITRLPQLEELRKELLG